MSRGKDKGRLAPFVPVDKEMMDSPAWRATSYGARWLYVHLKRRWSFKQKNNGRIFISQRDAEEEMGRGCRDSLSRWYRELQHYGFIVMTEAGCLGVEGKGKAPHWRLTEAEWSGGRGGNTWMLPTKDYLKWDGKKFQDDRGAVLRARKRKQNPGPQIQARAARKYRPGLARKCGSLPPATGPQMQAISDTPSGPQMQAISRYTTPLPVSADASSVPSPSIAPSDGADLHRKPWTTPTVTEISFDDLPEELRLMALGLPVDGRAADDGTIPPWGDLPADLNPF